MRRLDPDCALDGFGKFGRTSSGEHHIHAIRIVLLERAGGVWIHDVPEIAVHTSDDSRNFLVRAPGRRKRSAIEVLEAVTTRRLEGVHDLADA